MIRTLEKIANAHAFAEHFHKSQIRKSKEPYISHLESVAIILAKFNQQCTTIQASLLHDILEDTTCTESELESSFGTTILELVKGVTKLERINYPSKYRSTSRKLSKTIFCNGQRYPCSNYQIG